MVQTGFQSYDFYKWDTGFTSSTTMGANTAANMHLGFNPIIGDFNPPKVEYGEEEMTFFSDLDTSLSYSTVAEPEETENEALYRDPIMAINAVFSHGSVSSSWSGSSNTVNGDFTSTSHRTYLVVQHHGHNTAGTSGHTNMVYYGTVITEWGLSVEKGKKMKEFWKWKARGSAVATQAPDMTAGFDDGKFDRTSVDGGFSNWDGSMTKGVHSTGVTLTAGGVAISHLNVENFKMGLRRPVEFLYNTTSRDAFDCYDRPRKYYLEVEATIDGGAPYSEIKNSIASRTRRTYKMTWQTNKYLQFTQGVLKKIEGPRTPKPGEVARVKLTYEGVPGTSGSLPTMSIVCTTPEATDPSNAIFHT